MPANRMYVTVPTWNIGKLCADLQRWVPLRNFFNAYALMNAEAIYDGQRGVDNNKRVFLLTVRDLPDYSVIPRLHGVGISVHVGRT